jgi:hypothetical protein
MATVPSYVTDSGVTVKLTATSSMPCRSWSLPAEKSCPASKASVVKHGESAVCGSCYAMAGFYRMSNVKDAQASRFAWVMDSLVHNNGDEFVSALVRMISDDVNERGEPIFRVHDSGDLFNHAYVNAWGRIADALPGVRLCPKTDPRDGRSNCEDCRSCFDGSEPVAYLEH